jgi:hypothetical protein
MGNITTMSYQTIKIKISSFRKLKRLKYLLDISMVDIIDKLLTEELNKHGENDRPDRNEIQHADCNKEGG